MRAALVALVAIGCAPPPVAPPVVVPTAPVAAVAPIDPDAPRVPLDPAVRTGTLPNGLAYFITDGAALDTNPHSDAYVGLAIRAGSLDETDAQLGAAHALVHAVKPLLGDAAPDADDLGDVTFDGTSYALSIGDDGDDPRALELDAERRLALLRRVIDSPLPPHDFSDETHDDPPPVSEDLLGTRRASHPPTAATEPPSTEAVAAFRKTWYRPDRIAVIVAGDFDPPAIHRTIEKLFGSLRAPSGPAPARPIEQIAPRTAPTVTVARDQNFAYELTQAIPHRALRGERDYRAALIDRLLLVTLTARLRTLDGHASRLAYAVEPLSDTLDLVRLDERIEDLDELWRVARELARLAAHGLTPAELVAGAKALALDRDDDDRDNRGRFDALAARFLDGTPYPGPALDDVAAHLIATVTTADTAAAARIDFALATRRLALRLDHFQLETTAEIVTARLVAIAAAPIEPWDRRPGARPLIEAPSPGAIVATRTERGATLWTLANGARVIFRPTVASGRGLPGAVTGGSIMIAAYDGRGWRRWPRPANARAAAAIASATGFGEVPGATLRDVLREHETHLAIETTAVDHAITVDGTQLPVVFEAAHLAATAPRRDPDAFDAWRTRAIALLPDAHEAARDAWFDQLARAIGNDPEPPRTGAGYDALDLDDALAAYRDSAGDVAHTTFAIVGPVTPEQVRPLVETYLASLPAGLGAQSTAAQKPAASTATLVPPAEIMGRVFDLIYTAPAAPGIDARDLDVLATVMARRIYARFAGRVTATVTGGVALDGRRDLQITGLRSVNPVIEPIVDACAHELVVIARTGLDREDVAGLAQRYMPTNLAETTWLEGIRAGLARDPLAVDGELTDPTYWTARTKPARVQATARLFGKPTVRIIYR